MPCLAGLGYLVEENMKSDTTGDTQHVRYRNTLKKCCKTLSSSDVATDSSRNALKAPGASLGTYLRCKIMWTRDLTGLIQGHSKNRDMPYVIGF